MDALDGLKQALDLWLDAPEVGPVPGTREMRVAWKAGRELPGGAEEWVTAQLALVAEGREVIDALHEREGRPERHTVWSTDEKGREVPTEVMKVPAWWGQEWHNVLLHWPWAEEYGEALEVARGELGES